MGVLFAQGEGEIRILSMSCYASHNQFALQTEREVLLALSLLKATKKHTPDGCAFCWRRRRDSNSRIVLPITRFPVARPRPTRRLLLVALCKPLYNIIIKCKNQVLRRKKLKICLKSSCNMAISFCVRITINQLALRRADFVSIVVYNNGL